LLFGADIGGYDEREIFECLKKEERAGEIFNKANNDLKEAIKSNDG